jgi:catechol 2,3-dioxygenase-like lactoylglutathione lyase family enzyme
MADDEVRWGFVTVDAADPVALATFWAAALGRPVADSWNQYVWLEAPEGHPKLAFQGVPDRAAGHSRVHLDLGARDLDATVARLLELGATHVRTMEEDGLRWVTLADPEGNELCVLPRADQEASTILEAADPAPPAP